MSPFLMTAVLPLEVIQYLVRTLGIWKARSMGQIFISNPGEGRYVEQILYHSPQKLWEGPIIIRTSSVRFQHREAKLLSGTTQQTNHRAGRLPGVLAWLLPLL